MKFIDEAEIEIQAGNGGPGAKNFRREKFVPFGGPDGGNGGRGGSVVLKATTSRHTLLDFKFRPSWQADDGKAGGGSLRDGRGGEDLIIEVPVGTSILDPATDEVIHDLDQDNASYIAAQGGRGGKGNHFFKSATNQVPTKTQPGEDGEHAQLKLSLKLVADVGIVGFPNAGKSTLISRISAAKPKVADYPFTTLEPNLGVAKGPGETQFVLADIPGLIPGAHLGKGLGIQFLKHVERTKVLAHLVDPYALDDSGQTRNPIESFELIQKEISAFSTKLAGLPTLVVITKIDAGLDPELLSSIISEFEAKGLRCLAISSVAGKGLEELKLALCEMLQAKQELDQPGQDPKTSAAA